MSENGDLHAYKKPTEKNESNVSVIDCEGVRGISTAVVRPHYGVNKLTKHSIHFITKLRHNQGKH
jgi:hypothetical protein